ncbi:gamma-glutamyltransferase family protein [Piscinibacter koreensis]|uniref:Gamma-glutamyltransferase n=1 Tax=Piscinibacter koreensis TaxID=2742824 RepID=A0A7Y6NJV2_9BURK|nr:gamma-glutamyltransferase [Schlegelella koreensis]NUZ04523.1 gamma-glutamyltransferase [Schlegelella koreensis]
MPSARALAATPAAAASATVVKLTRVSETRVDRTRYDYVFQVTVQNGSVAQSGITANLTGAGAGTGIVDGRVAVGSLGANESATPADTITLRVDRSLPFDLAGLQWAVAGTPVQVVTFDPALCTAQAGAPGTQTVGLVGTNVMVASADVNASAAGCRVLARGGSAVDAAIAVQAVLGVVEPFASGLAGGSVITLYDAATKKVRTFDGLASAPANIGASTTTSIYQMAVASDLQCRSGQSIGGSISAQQGNTNISGRATGVPGTLKVLDLAHQAYGKKPWGQLWDEAIGLATNGFPMTRYMYSTLYSDGTQFDDETGEPLDAGGVKAWWNTARDRWGAVRCQYKDIKARYCDPSDATGTRPLAVGTLIRNLPLADTMTKVRDGGAAAFYDPNGPIAASILRRFQEDKTRPDGSNNCTSILPATYNADGTTSAAIIPARIPSLMAASDFANYRAVERKPLTGQHFGTTIYTQPAPLFGGVVTLYSLGLLERLGVANQAWATPGFYYLALEASRLANADRRNIVGDPAYSNVNARVAALLSPPYLDARAALVNGRALGTVSAGGTAQGIPAFAATDPATFDPLASRSAPAAATRFASRVTPRSATPLHDGDWNTTSSLAIIDGYGNALAMTTTINTHWGAHIEAAGMMLNNAMSNFSASTPGIDVNGYAANKRPRSSIAPSIALDASGRVRLVWGSAGGGPIPDYIVKTFLGNMVYGMDIQAAINADNWTGQSLGSSVAQVESGKPIVGLIPGMRSTYGYTTTTLGETGLTSGLAGIAVDYDVNGLPVYRGAADYRRAGGANGY